jgi:Flp pilus assembly protein TadG
MFKNLRKKLKKSEKGVTAVEFALIAAPFFFLIFALIEIMLIFFVQTTLEAGLASEARKIKTGQAQNSSTPISRSEFKTAVCDRMFGMLDCDNRLFVMVEAFGTTVPSGPLARPWDDGVLTPGSNSDEPYATSAAGDMVIVRAYYIWPLITPGFSYALSNYSDTNMGNYNRILVATSAFRNEPFN